MRALPNCGLAAESTHRRCSLAFAADGETPLSRPLRGARRDRRCMVAEAPPECTRPLRPRAGRRVALAGEGARDRRALRTEGRARCAAASAPENEVSHLLRAQPRARCPRRAGDLELSSRTSTESALLQRLTRILIHRVG